MYINRPIRRIKEHANWAKTLSNFSEVFPYVAGREREHLDVCIYIYLPLSCLSVLRIAELQEVDPS